MWSAILAALNARKQRRNYIRSRQDEALANGPSWRYRRRLIYGAYILGVAMVIGGGLTVFTDSQVGVELIVGGVALISIIVTAYTTSATFEDVRLWQPKNRQSANDEEDLGH